MCKALDSTLIRFYLFRSYTVSAAAGKDNPFDCFRIVLCLSMFENVSIEEGKGCTMNRSVAKIVFIFYFQNSFVF